MGGSYQNRKRQRQELLNDLYTSVPISAVEASPRKLLSRPVYHYPSTLPFPVLLDADFPADSYHSRNTDIKSAVHWGQRKLLLSEIQLLSMYCKRDVSYHIVYAGSAPGTHLAFLDEMYGCGHTWELIDPGQFDRPMLESRPNFWLRNEFFTNATAYGINARRLTEVLPALGFVYQHIAVDTVQAEKKAIHERLQTIVGTLDVARGTEDIPAMYEPPLALPKGLELLSQVGLERNKPLLFVSDIRSGSVALPNFEDHVAENMRAQECWTNILHGVHSMLKFRLPYTSKAAKFGGRDQVRETRLIREDGTVPYLRGDMLLPIWTRPTSTEGRLVVPQGAFQKAYNVAALEDQFFFFNAKVREQVHFNHVLCTDTVLDHHFDAAAEVHCLLTYLCFMRPELESASPGVLRKAVLQTSKKITEHLKITFADAIRRRDALMVKQAMRQSSAVVTDGEAGTAGHAEDEEEEEEEREVGVSLPEVDSSRTQQQQSGAHLETSPTPVEASAADTAVATSTTPPASAKITMSEWEATTRFMVRLAAYDRTRPLWHGNMNESKFASPSGFWVTTKMPQE